MTFLTLASAATTPTTDPLLALFTGAVAAAIIGIAGTLIGAAIQNHREHKRWVREQRMTAYREFLRSTEKMWPAQSKDQNEWRAHMDEMGTALGAVTIVGPASVTTAATDHLDASNNFSSVQRHLNGVEDGKRKPELEPELRKAAQRTEATLLAFVAAAQKHLKIKDE